MESAAFSNLFRVKKYLPKNPGPGFIRHAHHKERKMSADELVAFWEAFEKFSVYHDLAVMQFYLLGRIQEPCGIQIQDISLRFRKLWIKNVCVWDRSKKFKELKPVPKNEEPALIYLNDTLVEILRRRLDEAEDGRNFLFQLDGEPLNYRSIQYQFNKALKKGATLTRQVGSSSSEWSLEGF